MLDQVGIAFLEGAPIIAELSFIRVSEKHWDLNTGGKFSLGNIFCRIASFIGASMSVPACTAALRMTSWAC
jgi:hypothetical protein